MLTLIKPLYDSFRGFIRKPDIAWFLHPVLCLAIVFSYGFTIVGWYIKNMVPATRKGA